MEDSTAISKTEICNLALAHIGNMEIVDFDENTDEAKRCRMFYEMSKKTALKDLNASFAIDRTVVGEFANYHIEFGDEHAFFIPDDCLKVLSVNDTKDYNVEGNKILCHFKEKINVKCISNVHDVNLFDEDFKLLFALDLASKICYPITLDFPKSQALIQLRDKQYIRASTKYGDDNRVKVISNHRFLRSKEFGVGNFGIPT